MLATMSRVLQFLPIVMRFGTGPVRPGTLHTYPAKSWGLTHCLISFPFSVHPSLAGWFGVDSEAAVDAISGICDSEY